MSYTGYKIVRYDYRGDCYPGFEDPPLLSFTVGATVSTSTTIGQPTPPRAPFGTTQAREEYQVTGGFQVATTLDLAHVLQTWGTQRFVQVSFGRGDIVFPVLDADLDRRYFILSACTVVAEV